MPLVIEGIRTIVLGTVGGGLGARGIAVGGVVRLQLREHRHVLLLSLCDHPLGHRVVVLSLRRRLIVLTLRALVHVFGYHPGNALARGLLL